MEANFHGVFIGINHYLDERNFKPLEYAEKDARDVRDVFVDPKIGFPKIGTVELLCGEKATKHNIEGTLNTILIKNCKPTDTIVVYYSGHGFLTGEDGDAFLTAYDSQMADIAFNPNAGLRMDYIYNSLFQKSQAKRILFVLDCCYSEAFIPRSKSIEEQKLPRDLIDNASFPQADGRIAIFSSPRNVQSRESETKKNGIFTFHLVEGLRGGEENRAVDDETGDVTVLSLFSYIKLRIPDAQPAGIAGKMIDRFVLTRNHGKTKTRKRHLDEEYWNHVTQEIASQKSHGGIHFIQSPLATCLPFIESLLSRVNALDVSENDDIGPLLLDVVKDLYDAQFASIVRIDDNKAKVGYLSRVSAKANAEDALMNFLSSQVLRYVNEKKLPDGVLGISSDVGVVGTENATATHEKNMIILLHAGPISDFMVIYGISNAGISMMGEPYAVVLKSLYANTNELNVKSGYSELKAAILDDLKATYNFLPIDLYDERFELFRTSLTKTRVVFEPMLYLDPEFLDIYGWEALARIGDADHAPAHLFKAAEMWGTRFMIELDKHMLRSATYNYRKLIEERGIRPNQIQPLSVNVYPASLMRRAYREAVDELMGKEKILPGDKLVLEISEKLPIVTDTPLSEPDTLQEFKRHLTHYTSAYRINFAIDDFGVGYSSVSRLASVSPFYMKIDRDVLLRKDFCELTIDYVKRMVGLNKTSSPVIVIEGFDGSTAMAVTLKQLYESGIKHVQGYVVGKAGPDLYDLGSNLIAELKQRLVE